MLSVLFYNLRRLNNFLDKNAKLAVEECLIFWKKARILTQEAKKCVVKLKAEYEKWRGLNKNFHRQTDTQKRNEEAFGERIDKLFDIALANALKKMADDTGREFLIYERSECDFFFVYDKIMFFKLKFFFSIKLIFFSKKQPY